MRMVPNSSKNPSVVTVPGLVGLERVIQTIQVSLQSLTWIEKSFGRAYTHMRKIDSAPHLNTPKYRNRNFDNVYYPAVYQGTDSSNRVKDFEDVLINDNLRAYSFIIADEQQNPQDYIIDELNLYQTNISIVFWVNLDAINKQVGPVKTYPYFNELRNDVNANIENCLFDTVGDRVTILNVETDPKKIYKEYTIDITRLQNLVYPYGSFRFNCQAQWIDEC